MLSETSPRRLWIIWLCCWALPILALESCPYCFPKPQYPHSLAKVALDFSLDVILFKVFSYAGPPVHRILGAGDAGMLGPCSPFTGASDGLLVCECDTLSLNSRHLRSALEECSPEEGDHSKATCLILDVVVLGKILRSPLVPKYHLTWLRVTLAKHGLN